MNRLMLPLSLMAMLSLAACDKPTVVNVPAPAAAPATTVVAVPGPAGPPGATGSQGMEGNKGDTGKAGEGTTVIVMPPAASATTY